MRIETARDLRADFVAAAADARAEGGNHVFGPRAEFHLHAAESFCGYAGQRAAPAGMNRRDRTPFRVGQKNGNAIRRLNSQQNAAIARK